MQQIPEDRKITITDNDGKEIDCYILFTTKLEDSEKEYIFFYDPKEDNPINNGDVIVAYIESDNSLALVTDENEWSKLEEVFNAFIQDSQKACDGCDKESCEGCENNEGD